MNKYIYRFREETNVLTWKDSTALVLKTIWRAKTEKRKEKKKKQDKDLSFKKGAFNTELTEEQESIHR